MNKMQKIPVAIVGLHFGHFFIKEQMGKPEFASLFDIRAVCDANEVRLAAARETFGCVGYADLDRLLAEADFEAVLLFSGPVGIRVKLMPISSWLRRT